MVSDRLDQGDFSGLEEAILKINSFGFVDELDPNGPFKALPTLRVSIIDVASEVFSGPDRTGDPVGSLISHHRPRSLPVPSTQERKG